MIMQTMETMRIREIPTYRLLHIMKNQMFLSVLTSYPPSSQCWTTQKARSRRTHQNNNSEAMELHVPNHPSQGTRNHTLHNATAALGKLSTKLLPTKDQ